MVIRSNQVEEEVDLNTYPFQPEALRLIPKAAAIKYDLIPLTVENDTLTVAMADISNLRVIQEMAAICKKRIVPLPADPAEIYRAIDYNYKSANDAGKQLRKASPRAAKTVNVIEQVEEQASVIEQAEEQVNVIEQVEEQVNAIEQVEEQVNATEQVKEQANVTEQVEERANLIDLNTYPLQPEAFRLIPASMAVKYNIMPLAEKKDTLTVAMADVNNMQAIQEVAAVTKKRIVPLQADPDQIRQVIEHNYESHDKVKKQPARAAPEEIVAEKQVDPNTYLLQPEVLKSIPVSMVVKYDIIPLAIENDTLIVAMADVNNMPAIQLVTAVTKKKITPLPADLDQIRQAIKYNYKSYDTVDEQPAKAAPKETKKASGAGKGIEQVDINSYPLQPEALRLIPASLAVRYNVLPLEVEKDTLKVAMADVNNMQAFQEMAAVSKKRIVPLQADPDEIRQAISLNYKSYTDIEKHLGKVEPRQETVQKVTEDVSDAPIVQALDIIMNEAVKARTSDIHIEPQEDRIRVRYRIDGVLQETMSLPLSAQSALISRIKVMARMNIADHRPQDGQLTFNVKNQEIDMRVATISTIYGEMATMRILDKSFAVRTLQDLGFSEGILEQYQEVLKAPMGMILVCGPTGSGKTTTLYASINSLDRKGRKVITVEDPVEYRFENINQIQVNPKADITFSSAVRSFMRHDPDILLIGEIRDSDTAAMAMQASLIGQLVLSSVHAKDTAGTVTRLLDLGIGPFLISATLVCVLSQRMARKVCPHCRELAKIPPEAMKAYYNETGDERTEFYVGRGCNACSQTGYLGRTVISEILVINHELRSAIMNNASADEIRDIARKSGMISMWHDGMLKAQAGITTPSEVLRNILFTG